MGYTAALVISTNPADPPHKQFVGLTEYFRDERTRQNTSEHVRTRGTRTHHKCVSMFSAGLFSIKGTEFLSIKDVYAVNRFANATVFFGHSKRTKEDRNYNLKTLINVFYVLSSLNIPCIS